MLKENATLSLYSRSICHKNLQTKLLHLCRTLFYVFFVSSIYYFSSTIGYIIQRANFDNDIHKLSVGYANFLVTLDNSLL